MIEARSRDTTGSVTWLASTALALTFAVAPQPTKAPKAGIISLGVGLDLALGGYLITSAYGADHMDEARSEREFEANKRLLVPVVGPFLAVPKLRSRTARGYAIFSGVVQTGATAAALTGSVLIARHRARHPAPPRRDLGIGLLSAGLGVMGTTTLLVGTISGFSLRNKPGNRFHRRMLIPLAGGFLAMPVAESYMAKWVAALVGTLQVSAVGMTIAGALILRKTRQPIAAAAFPMRGGAQASFAFRF